MQYNGFFDLDQMRAYLRRCVIRIEHEPIFVWEVEEKRNKGGRITNRIIYTKLGLYNEEGPVIKNEDISIKDKRVNFSPVPLGFVNFPENECIIVNRMPTRNWKIGLCSNNITISPVAGKRERRDDINSLLVSVNLRNCILGIYPLFATALRLTNGGDVLDTIAFHRHFALQKRKEQVVLIYYKYKVAIGSFKDGELNLRNSFSFLKEHLEGARNVS